MPAKRPANRPLVIEDAAAAARWEWVVKPTRSAYAQHRLSRVVGPGGDAALLDGVTSEIEGIAVCGAEGPFSPAGENKSSRFNAKCVGCLRRIAVRP